MKHLLKDANGSGSSTPFVDSSGNTVTFKSGVWDRIKDNMVLWYDLKRQGATNETMAANPKLIDLSGNGHDATCYNFAWSGMSGIGGFPFSFGVNKINFPTWNYTTILERTDNSIKLKLDENATGTWVIQILNNAYSNIKYGLYVETDNDASSTILIADKNYQIQERKNLHNGLNIIEPFSTEKLNLPCDVYVQIQKGVTISLTLIPIYPNALIADGVDDYIQAINIPALDDYTIICKRKIFDFSSTSRGLIQKGEMINGKAANTFLLEFASRVNRIDVAVSFDAITNITLETNDITYQTKYSYNGKVNLNIGKLIDNVNNFNIALYAASAGKMYLPCALYSCILFNRTLTTKEINWVKNNLIEGDTEL